MSAQSILGEVKHNENGFEYIRFQEKRGHWCILQQSSLAEYEPPGSSGIRIGFDSRPRIHLTLIQVQQLVAHLEAWVARGSFVLTKE